MRWGQRQYRVLHRSRSHPPPTPIEVVMRRRRKTASSRVSGLLRTQRRCRRAFSLPPVRIWARRTAQTRSSGIFLEIPAVFFYFWNETAGAETAGLSPAAAPGPVGCHSEHADTSWVCAQAVRNARTAAFCYPNSVFWRHISGLFGGPRTRPSGGHFLVERSFNAWRRCNACNACNAWAILGRAQNFRRPWGHPYKHTYLR